MSCGNCSGCTSSCSGCSGCARDLVLTEKEVAFLQYLGQVAFLPVARKMGEETPIYLEEGDREENSLLLLILEKKGLISLDYDKPLKNFDMSAYSAYPVQGSIALTERGQKVLEILDLQVWQDE